MTATFPVTLDVFTSIPASTTQDVAIGGRTHRVFHVDEGDAIEALEAKVGTGASTPAANSVFVATATGISQWLAGLTSAYLAANAATKVAATSQLAGASTASTSQVAIANISFTAPTGGEDVALDLSAAVRNSAINNTTTFQAKIDSGTLVNCGYAQQGPADAAYQHNISGRVVFLAVAAGAHTATVTWAVAGGTSTIDFGQFNVTEYRR
jgi:hypothetical protein